MIKKFIEHLRKLFGKNAVDVVTEEVTKETCKHQFTGWRFVKGGGRARVCKLCGYIEKAK